MALTSPALTLGVHALFGNVTPALDIIKKLGVTDFSDGADGIIEVKPGATIKVPVSSVSKALAYNETTNNYLTGGATGEVVVRRPSRHLTSSRVMTSRASTSIRVPTPPSSSSSSRFARARASRWPPLTP